MCIPTTDAKHFFKLHQVFLDSSVGLTNTLVILFRWGEETAGMEVPLCSTEQCAVLICNKVSIVLK